MQIVTRLYAGRGDEGPSSPRSAWTSSRAAAPATSTSSWPIRRRARSSTTRASTSRCSRTTWRRPAPAARRGSLDGTPDSWRLRPAQRQRRAERRHLPAPLRLLRGAPATRRGQPEARQVQGAQEAHLLRPPRRVDHRRQERHQEGRTPRLPPHGRPSRARVALGRAHDRVRATSSSTATTTARSRSRSS